MRGSRFSANGLASAAFVQPAQLAGQIADTSVCRAWARIPPAEEENTLMQANPGSPAGTDTGHRHVLSVCVLRYYFELPAEETVVFDEDGYSVEEAKRLGLKPLMAARLAFDGQGYAAVRVERLDRGLALGQLLQQIWEHEGAEFKGPPTELLVDSWLIDSVPELKSCLKAVGCFARSDVGRKQVAGGKGVLQRHRFKADGRLTVESINAIEREYEGFRWAILNAEAAGWRHTSSGETRAWPQGVSFGQCLLTETSALWDKVPAKSRPQRDPEGDFAIARALRVLTGGSRLHHDATSRATVLRGTKLLVEALKPGLDDWMAGLSWCKGAYLFAGTESGCGIVRLRLGVPVDTWAKVLNRPQKLPAHWPHLNQWTSKIEGFGLEVQLWDFSGSVELNIAVVVEGAGRWWIKDALKSKQSSDIARLVRRGKFKVTWQDLGKKQLKDAWDELSTTLAHEQTCSGLCLERRFEHHFRIDEVVKAMRDALDLANTLMYCAVETSSGRASQ